ncbi:hypothetical protein VFPPC_17411 [Pochonia chlamydosporia 170]|uniref:Uncharacterized protein n=1 Tax=Pochonia chlamydosporia 170 TaxID=1380566 RepID=A0A219ARS3_METCM|nr:hypothetical protein VFPPC_17411 [Pochonia chlamydosporia 170]OWT43440.1 hypothetical protein VFPPC_17411 [Pochonia chlamydosporia 170]
MTIHQWAGTATISHSAASASSVQQTKNGEWIGIQMPNSGSPQRYLYNGEARAANLGQFLFLFLPSPSIHSKARVGGVEVQGRGCVRSRPLRAVRTKGFFLLFMRDPGLWILPRLRDCNTAGRE